MGRGVSCGGGQSSLGYLFGGGETASANKTKAPIQKPVKTMEAAPNSTPPQTAAGIYGKPTNNYQRAEGQNCGNFITDRPSTKVHSVPGGGSSLGYLFGGGSGGN